MAVQKPQGAQLDIQNIAADIAADPTAIGDIATGVTSDPGATATLDADYLRVDGTNEAGVALFANDANYTTDVIVAGNHYTKSEADAGAGNAGAKIDKVSGATNGNVATMTGAGVVQDGGTLLANLALTADHYTKVESDAAAGSAGAKIDKVSGDTAGNVATMDGSGEVQDGGTLLTDLALDSDIGTTIQAWAAALDSISGLSETAGDVPYATSDNAYSLTPSTAYGRALLNETDAASTRGTLGVPLTTTPGAANNIALLDGAGDIVDSAAQLSDFAGSTHTHVEADITDLGVYLTDITSESLADLSDVTEAVTSQFHAIARNAGDTGWESRLLVEADISDLGTYAVSGHTHTESDITDLGTYVAEVTGTSGNVVEFGAANVIADSGVATTSLAPLASPTFTGVPTLPTYTLGTLPAVGSGGGMIYVSDATGGGTLTGSMCFSNGSVWIDPSTGIAVA